MRAAKALVTAIPVLAVYGFFVTRALVSFCAKTESTFLCNSGFIVYVVGIVVIARLFFLWLRSEPKGGAEGNETHSGVSPTERPRERDNSLDDGQG